MRVITWNVRGAKEESRVWDLALGFQSDILLLQEVGGIPEKITRVYSVLSRPAATKKGGLQRFSTAVLVKGMSIREISLRSEYNWVNRELEFFKGNFISCVVKPPNEEPLNVVSVYCPAWWIDKNRLKGIDTSAVKLKENPKVWATEIIWSALKNTVSNNEKWMVGGDYNSSETFDREWQDKNGVRFGLRSSGNKEILDRMENMGFIECLRASHEGRIVPTFRHSREMIAHQLDKLFVTRELYSRLKSCDVGDQEEIFAKSLSDHLPIIADFSEK
jgi:exonuclease III